MRTRVSAALLLLFAVAVSLPAFASASDAAPLTSVTSVVRSADFARATDLVFVAEGYKKDEQARFESDARAMTASLEESPAAEPMRRARVFNEHFVFMASSARASSTDTPAATPLRARVEDERVLVDEERLERAARHAPDADVVIALVRFAHADGVRATARIPRLERDGWRRGAIAIPSTERDDFLHELAHALWGLGDEYAEKDAPLTDETRDGISERANLSADPSGARWRWAGIGRPLEGAGRLRRGVYRPERDCLMRDIAAPAFCSVCRGVLGGAFDGDPGLPVLTATQGPLSGPILVAGVPVEARWRAAPVVAWELVLVRISAREDELVRRELEGHQVSLTLPALPPGRYELRLRARNVAPHASPWAALPFTVVRTAE